jgi:DNA-binding response OmpR family regulator
MDLTAKTNKEIYTRLDKIRQVTHPLLAEIEMLQAEIRRRVEFSLPKHISNKLIFESKKVCWNGGKIEIKGVLYRLLQSLWDAPKKRLKTVCLCTAVWGDGATKQKNLQQSLWRLNKLLRKKRCPFIIKSKKDPKSGEVIGYRIVKNNNLQK